MSPVETDLSPRHVALVGGMGVGKTSVGRLLAERLGRPLLDSDDHLAAGGETGRELAEREGVTALHRAEAQHLLDALASEEPAVVAAAASVVDSERCLAAFRSADVVWLRADPETAVGRMEHSSHRRDLGPDTRETVTDLAARRAARYEEVADLTIDTDRLRPIDTVVQVVAWLMTRYS